MQQPLSKGLHSGPASFTIHIVFATRVDSAHPYEARRQHTKPAKDLILDFKPLELWEMHFWWSHQSWYVDSSTNGQEKLTHQIPSLPKVIYVEGKLTASSSEMERSDCNLSRISSDGWRSSIGLFMPWTSPAQGAATPLSYVSLCPQCNTVIHGINRLSSHFSFVRLPSWDNRSEDMIWHLSC